MRLKWTRATWGFDGWLTALPQLRAAGYEAIETPISTLSPVRDEALAKFKSLGLDLILQHVTVGNTAAEHAANFREGIEWGKRHGAKKMVVHSGRDAFDDADAKAFFGEVVRIEQDMPFQVGHETHRSRVFFNPWRTRSVLEQFPTLKLTCDFSHWVCVAERLDWDNADGSILKLAADRAIHLHARVGYEQGPQVPDPAAPAYASQLASHLSWWRRIWASQAARGMTESTITAEFGPPPYLHTTPHTEAPVADQATICEWMRGQLDRAFAQRSS